jgi:ribonuclease R
LGLQEQIVSLLKVPGADYSQNEILKALKLPRSLRRRLDDVLGQLCEEGTLKETRGHRYVLARKSSGASVTGIISFSSRGAGFVAVQGMDRDLFVPPSRLGWSLPGDEVEVSLLPPRQREERPAAEVIRVLKRGRPHWVGRLEGGSSQPVLRVRLGDVELDLPLRSFPSGGRQGDWLMAEAPPAEVQTEAEARVRPLELLGGEGKPNLDTLILIKKAGLREEFPPEVLHAASRIPPEVREEDSRNRLDLRSQTVFTIDGADAKDFDDAVSIEPLPDGGYRLGVHIADVGHYVQPGSVLDKEAFARGTSTYLPDRVLPMLPEALSNGVCSLKEGVDRLTQSAVMDFDGQGRMLSSRFAESVICSVKRFTYEEVQEILDRRPEAGGRGPTNQVKDSLFLMERLARKLLEIRHGRGALDFDFPETKVELDAKGEVKNLYRRPRIFAHRLIEEFMLSANEAVASELARRRIPLLFRIHEEPDPEKLADTLGLLARFKLGAPTASPVQPQAIQKLLERAEGRPEERLVNTLILRSLKLARYSPENAGHFGLALKEYCHFTSPIRRYPDLVVHRMLRLGVLGRGLRTEETENIHRRLVSEGEICSANERKAEACERDCVKAKQIRFLEKRLGETYEATITSVTEFGLFAEIKEFPAEGLVHIRTLTGDLFRFDARSHALVGQSSKKAYSIGDGVKIKILRTDWEALRVDFTLV